MPAFRSSAIVLQGYDFSEADRVMVFFTREEGKIRALAKGVRRSRSRLAGCLGLLTLSELQFHGKENQELLLVTQGQLETAFPALKTDLEALGQAGRMAELIDRMIPERQALTQVFDLLLAGLRLLEEGLRPALAGIWFEISLLDLLGYRPRLDACHVCGEDKERMAYQPEAGGVICAGCGPAELALSPGTRRLLVRCPEMAPEKVRSLRLHPQIEGEAVRLLDVIARHHLGRSLKSDVFRRAVKRLKNV